ncbi:MAG TPA: tetratricopeptide repeat protein [Phenylobacterium sp.]|nr:tetratricopeptide repeat protein [Phenylobacterium sp.]
MTRLSLAGASALALVLLASAPPALAQTPQDAAACEDGAKLGLEARLQVCDRVIATATAASAAQAHVTRAHLLVDAGRPEEAEADAEAAVKLSPDDPQSLTTRGVVRYELKKYDLALADFDTAGCSGTSARRTWPRPAPTTTPPSPPTPRAGGPITSAPSSSDRTFRRPG